MADRSKFEKMLELLINEDKEAAQELFHELVVEKSRDIYESLLEDEDEEVDENEDDDLDESDDEDEDDEDEDDLDEGFNLDEFEVEADPMSMGGDPADDMMMDLEPEDEDDMDMDMDMGDEDGDVEDRITDIEDALEDLKAEFEKMMSGDEDDMDMDDEEGDMDMDMGDDDEEEKESFRFEADDDEVDESDEDLEEAKKMKMKKDEKNKKSASEQMREYVEKIGGDRYNAYGKMGDNGSNTKSPVAKPNNMGGTTQNILRGGSEDSGEANKGPLKGSPISDTSPKDMKTGNINVPGAKAGKTAFKSKIAGGGIDNNSPLKKSSDDKSAKSPINGVKTRAK